MDHQTAKLCVDLLNSRDDRVRELVTKVVDLDRDFQNELRVHMDTKLEVARLKDEVAFLKSIVDDRENP